MLDATDHYLDRFVQAEIYSVKGNPKEAAEAIITEDKSRAIVDILPLTLEEIFIYEMGGRDYEVKDVLF